MIRFLFASLLTVFFAVSAYAQRHDESKYQQIRSMEIGPWDFSPDKYYYFLHKDYSGGYVKTKWSWGIPQWYHKFDENRSKVKRVLPVREKALAVELLKDQEVEKEEKHMKAMLTEESKRSADRNVDAMYGFYKDDFTRLNQQLLEGFDYILAKSNKKLAKEVTALSTKLNLINDHIAYIHKTGVGYELENMKRKKAYIAAKKDLEALVAQTRRLGVSASLLY